LYTSALLYFVCLGMGRRYDVDADHRLTDPSGLIRPPVIATG
jgi:hypothetical protein